MGWTGVENSRKFWNSQKGVLMQGTNTTQAEYDELAVTEVNGMKIAFLAYCENTNGIYPDTDYEVNYFPGNEDAMLEKVRRAKQECDAVIVSMHWGTEYSMEANETQTSLARQLADRCFAGVQDGRDNGGNDDAINGCEVDVIDGQHIFNIDTILVRRLEQVRCNSGNRPDLAVFHTAQDNVCIPDVDRKDHIVSSSELFISSSRMIRQE